MTNVADAISAMHRMLRPGRYAAERSPSVTWPPMAANPRECSHADSSNSPAVRSSAPAPKNPAV